MPVGQRWFLADRPAHRKRRGGPRRGRSCDVRAQTPKRFTAQTTAPQAPGNSGVIRSTDRTRQAPVPAPPSRTKGWSCPDQPRTLFGSPVRQLVDPVQSGCAIQQHRAVLNRRNSHDRHPPTIYAGTLADAEARPHEQTSLLTSSSRVRAPSDASFRDTGRPLPILRCALLRARTGQASADGSPLLCSRGVLAAGRERSLSGCV